MSQPEGPAAACGQAQGWGFLLGDPSPVQPSVCTAQFLLTSIWGRPQNGRCGESFRILGAGICEEEGFICLRETGWSPAPPGWPGRPLLTTTTPGLSRVPALVSLQRKSLEFSRCGVTQELSLNLLPRI